MEVFDCAMDVAYGGSMRGRSGIFLGVHSRGAVLSLVRSFSIERHCLVPKSRQEDNERE
jgi:hypothetical protein